MKSTNHNSCCLKLFLHWFKYKPIICYYNHSYSVFEICAKSWPRNPQVILDLTSDLSFKVIGDFQGQTYTNHAISPLFLPVYTQCVWTSYKKSWPRYPLVILDLTCALSFKVFGQFETILGPLSPQPWKSFRAQFVLELCSERWPYGLSFPADYLLGQIWPHFASKGHKISFLLLIHWRAGPPAAVGRLPH